MNKASGACARTRPCLSPKCICAHCTAPSRATRSEIAPARFYEFKLDLMVDEAELAKRREGWSPNPPRYTQGVLGKYARLVQGAETGAITNTK